MTLGSGGGGDVAHLIHSKHNIIIIIIILIITVINGDRHARARSAKNRRFFYRVVGSCRVHSCRVHNTTTRTHTNIHSIACVNVFVGSTRTHAHHVCARLFCENIAQRMGRVACVSGGEFLRVSVFGTLFFIPSLLQDRGFRSLYRRDPFMPLCFRCRSSTRLSLALIGHRTRAPDLDRACALSLSHALSCGFVFRSLLEFALDYGAGKGQTSGFSATAVFMIKRLILFMVSRSLDVELNIAKETRYILQPNYLASNSGFEVSIELCQVVVFYPWQRLRVLSITEWVSNYTKLYFDTKVSKRYNSMKSDDNNRSFFLIIYLKIPYIRL